MHRLLESSQDSEFQVMMKNEKQLTKATAKEIEFGNPKSHIHVINGQKSKLEIG